MIRFRIPGQGFYDDIGFTGIFYGSAGYDPPGIAIEDYFEHDVRRISGSAQIIVTEGGAEGTQVKLIDEVGFIQRSRG
jgi:hypothetical protein